MSHFETTDRIRVLVLYNESIISAGLCAALSLQPELEIQTGAQGDARGGALDVIVSDYETAIALAQSSQQGTGPAILALTSMASEAAVVKAMELGVKGYVLLDSALEELITAIKELAAGTRYLSQTVAHRLVESLGRETLTSRESEVLRCLSLGHCNKAIARDLGISISTVKTHVKAVMGKLSADSRTHAVTVAAQRGLVAITAKPFSVRHGTHPRVQQQVGIR